MGQAVVKAVLADAELSLVAAVDVHGGEDAGEIAGCGKCGVTVATDLAQALLEAKPDVMVDFTRPDVVFSNAMLAVQHGVSPVIGTTGMTADEKAQLEALSLEKKTPVFLAPNFAIGAVLMMLMSRQAAKYMPHVEIIELHHDNKLGGLGQTLTIRHDSINRESFMPGVVLACKKVRDLAGLVVGLEKLLD